MSYTNHAKEEFYYAGWTDENGNFDDEMQELMCTQVLALLEMFSSHGHSGSSAPYAINLFKRLAMFDSVSPLSGEEKEWAEPYDEDGNRQNKRQGDVFMDSDGSAYWSSGRVFCDENGSCFTSSKSRVEIEFPWVKPDRPEYINVTTNEAGDTIYPDGI